LVIEPLRSRAPLESSRQTSPRYAASWPARREAPPVADLGREHHGALERDPAETLQACDHRREYREQRELLDLPVELLPALQLVGEQRVILPEHQAIRRRER
jgi:hypothetical protein